MYIHPSLSNYVKNKPSKIPENDVLQIYGMKLKLIQIKYDCISFIVMLMLVGSHYNEANYKNTFLHRVRMCIHTYIRNFLTLVNCFS